MRRLFKGGVTNAETLAGDYSRAATIRGRRLIDEIRYVICSLDVNKNATVTYYCSVYAHGLNYFIFSSSLAAIMSPFSIIDGEVNKALLSS